MAPPRSPSPMRAYRSSCDSARRPVLSSYFILGFISSGTYGRVYKARLRPASTTTFDPTRPTRPGDKDGKEGELFAIKKFKPDKEGEAVTYTGISQSAIREIAINRELSHVNVASLREVILQDKSIFMVFSYAEHDLLQLIHHHSQSLRLPFPPSTLRSLLWQLLNGVLYLHTHHILHRDLKPANILVTSAGCVKIGDLGLARVGRDPLQPLWQGDKVVVTIWYRSPELVLGGRHYTGAVDIWAVGCIYAELLSLRPIFKGEEAKIENKKQLPFQKDQMLRILEVLGTIDKERWPSLSQYPEASHLARFEHFHPSLAHWYKTKSGPSFSPKGFALLERMFEYDPSRRCTAREALDSPFFREGEGVNLNAFQGTRLTYPDRRVTNDDLTLTSQQSHPPLPLPSSLAQQQVLPQSRPGSFYPAPAGTAAVVAAGGGSIPPPAPPTNPPPPVYPPTGPGTGGPTRPGSYRPGSTGGGGGGGASVGASGSGRGVVGKKSRLG